MYPKNKYNKDGFHHYCKSCNNEDHRIRYLNSSEYRNKLKFNGLRNLYKITQENYLRMLNNQNNKCAICNNEFKSNRLTLIDHNHINGNVRGLLCPNCNNLLGNSKDSIEILKSAISYLEKNYSDTIKTEIVPD